MTERGPYEPLVLAHNHDGRIALTAWSRLGDGMTVMLTVEEARAFCNRLNDFAAEAAYQAVERSKGSAEHEYADKCECNLCVRVRIEDMG